MAACNCGDIGKFLIEGGKRSKIRGGVCLVFIRMLRVEAAEGITELLDNPHCIFRRGPDVLVLFAVGFVRMIMGRFVVCILVLMVVRILVLMIVCVAVGLHSLDGFLGNGVNAVHQRHYLFVRGIDRIKDCLDPGIGIAADVDEEITFGNRNHIARCRFKRVTFRTRGKQHVEIEMIAADGAQKIILRKNRSHGGEFRVLLGIRRLF